MKPWFMILVSISAAAIWTDCVQAQPNSQQPPTKVGMIYVVGNDVTQDRVILQTIGLYPSQPFRHADLKTAEQKLRRLGIFDANPDTQPTVEVIPSPDDAGVFKDILVRVKETQTGRFAIWAGFEASGRVVLRFELEEKNLDPLKIPMSMADIWDGRASRGAAHALRIRLTLR